MSTLSTPPAEQPSSIHVLLVEDDVRFRVVVARALAQQAGLTLVGEVGSIDDAERAFHSTPRIDVALVDLKLGSRSGIDFIRWATSARPDVACVALTVFEDAETIRAAIGAGARGYVLKDTPPERLAEIAREASMGGAPMTGSVARWVLDTFRDKTPAADGPKSHPETLTSRERDIVALLCEGRTYVEVATALTLSVGTVQTHVKSVYKKLHVASKAELTALAFRSGLVT